MSHWKFQFGIQESFIGEENHYPCYLAAFFLATLDRILGINYAV